MSVIASGTASLAATPLAQAADKVPVTIAILHTIDIHGHKTAWHGSEGPRPKDDGQLVTSGIYARVRHPLYVNVTALGFAWAFLWRSGPALALGVLQMPFFDLKARGVERRLRERFASYGDYVRRVKRFIAGIY